MAGHIVCLFGARNGGRRSCTTAGASPVLPLPLSVAMAYPGVERIDHLECAPCAARLRPCNRGRGAGRHLLGVAQFLSELCSGYALFAIWLVMLLNAADMFCIME